MISQIIVNIFFSTCIYLLIATALTLTYRTSNFFNLAQASYMVLSAYFLYLFYIFFHLSLFLSILFAVICTVITSVICELGIFEQMRRKNYSSFTLLIASIGLYTVIQNLISLIFGDETKSIRTGEVKTGYEILDAYVTDIQIISATTSIFLFVALLIFFRVSLLGKLILAVSSNSDLSNIYGINSTRVILWTTVMSSILISIVGIFIAYDLDLTTSFGFRYFLYGAVAMIIGGVNSHKSLALGSLILASIQNLSAYYTDTKWMDAITYIILISFLVWKPLGFSGQQLKKIEV